MIVLYALAYKKKSYQLAAYIPTVWTSLGIFFTFLSIFLALSDQDFRMKIQNPENNQVILDLIDKIIPAFSTSMIGIIGAIITSILNKIVLAIVEQKEENRQADYYGSVVHKKGDYSPEMVLIDVVEVIKKQTEEIHTSNVMVIEKLNSLLLLIPSLNETTNSTISTALHTQKEDFIRAIDEINISFGKSLDAQNRTMDMNLKSMENMLKEKMDSVQRENRSMIADYVKTQKESLENTSTNLANESLERNRLLTEYITSEREKFEKILSDMRKLFEEDVRQIIQQFANEQHELSITTINKFNEKLKSDALVILEGVRQKLDELYKDQFDLVEKTILVNKEAVDKSLEENRTSIQTILGANKAAIEDISNEIKADNNNLRMDLAAMQKQWKEDSMEVERNHHAEVVRIHTNAEKELQDLLAKLIGIESALQQSLGTIKNEITKSIQEFENKQEEVKTFIVNKNKDLQIDLTNQIQKASQIDRLQTACAMLLNNTNSTINALNTLTSNISSSLASINNSLEGSSKKYIETVVNSNDLLAYINGTLLVDKDNITSVFALLGEIETLKKVTEEIEEDIKYIKSLQDSEK